MEKIYLSGKPDCKCHAPDDFVVRSIRDYNVKPLSTLPHGSNVTEITSGHNIFDVLDVAAVFPALKKFHYKIGNCGSGTDKNLRVEIRSISLEEIYIEGFYPRKVELVLWCPNLKKLHAPDCIKVDLNCPALEILDLVHNRIKHLKLQLPSLVSLSFRYSETQKITLDCPRLESLTCECCYDIQTLELVHTCLKKLNCACCFGLEKLRLVCPALKEIHVSHCELNMVELECPFLERLCTYKNLSKIIPGLEYCADLVLLGCSEKDFNMLPILMEHIPTLRAVLSDDFNAECAKLDDLE